MKYVWIQIGMLGVSVATTGLTVYIFEITKMPPILLEFSLAEFVFLALLMLHRTPYLVNRSQYTIIADQDGIVTRNRWTGRRVRWHDINLFWIQPANAIRNAELADLIMMNVVRSYEIATSVVSLTIPLVRTDPLNELIQVDDPATYGTRMHALVAMIQRRSGVPLRAQNTRNGRRSRS